MGVSWGEISLCCRGTSSEWLGAYASRRIKPVSKAKIKTTLALATQFPCNSRYKTALEFAPNSCSSRSPPFLFIAFSGFKQVWYEFHRQSIPMSSTKRTIHVILAHIAFLLTRRWHPCLGWFWKFAELSNNLQWHGLQTGPWLLATGSGS